MFCEQPDVVVPPLKMHSDLPGELSRARTPLEVLCALAKEGANHDLDLWAMAAVRDGQPGVYLCSLPPLDPFAAASHLSHFVSCAGALDCPSDLLMPDWGQAPQQVVCLEPSLRPVGPELAEYRDVHVPTGAATGVIVRAAALAATDGVPQPLWSRLQVLLRYAAPYLRALDLANSDTAQGMIDVESGAYSWPCFLDALEREVERARRAEAELSLAALELRPLKMMEEISPDLHRRIGDHIAAVVRRSDLVGRTGKRSYAVFYHDTGPRPGLIATGRIADRLRADDEITSSVSFSLGVSGWEACGPVEVCTLLSQAGEAAAEAAQMAPGRPFVYI